MPPQYADTTRVSQSFTASNSFKPTDKFESALAPWERGEAVLSEAEFQPRCSLVGLGTSASGEWSNASTHARRLQSCSRWKLRSGGCFRGVPPHCTRSCEERFVWKDPIVMRITRVTFGVMIFGILCANAAAQESKSTYEPDPLRKQAAASANDEAETPLQRALYFADLYNWHASRPYFTKAQQLFEAAGDKRNALYAHFGAIRAGADAAPITELSYGLAQELATNPILQSDKELRMFCLIVKGDFDGEIDVPAMRRDWTEVAALARELANTKWQYRAQGQLGLPIFMTVILHLLSEMSGPR